MATDPRAASVNVKDGPPDLIGRELMIVTRVLVDGIELHLPKALPGVLEYVTVAHAETRANELLATLVHGLDDHGLVSYQSDTARCFEFLAAGGTAVATAVTGLESFANHHMASFCPPPTYDANGALIGTEPTIIVFGDPAHVPRIDRQTTPRTPWQDHPGAETGAAANE